MTVVDLRMMTLIIMGLFLLYAIIGLIGVVAGAAVILVSTLDLKGG